MIQGDESTLLCAVMEYKVILWAQNGGQGVYGRVGDQLKGAGYSIIGSRVNVSGAVTFNSLAQACMMRLVLNECHRREWWCKKAEILP